MNTSAKTHDDNLVGLPLDGFLAYLEHERGLSPYTVRNYRQAVIDFFAWMQTQKGWEGGLDHVLPIQLRGYVIESQRTLSKRTLHNRISALRTFYKWALRERRCQVNPATGLVLPKLEKTLPKYLTETQMKALLRAPTRGLENVDPAHLAESARFDAWRDRLCLELLYGAGLRVSEAATLTFGQVDRGNGMLRVIGKGRKERIIPLGPVGTKVINYVVGTFQRPCGYKDLVLTNWNGKPFSARRIQLMLKRYLILANLPADLTPHKIRHSFATHMLDRGAELRALQAMLGHTSLSTTQVYTHVSVSRLKDAHRLAHPRS